MVFNNLDISEEGLIAIFGKDVLELLLREHSYDVNKKESSKKHHTKRIMSIRQAKIHGEVIVAKPVLLLALIDGIEDGEFTGNRFILNEWLEKRYLALMKQYTRNSQFPNPADISNPFWHLQSDGFWHLIHKATVAEGSTPTKRWLKENVTYGHFDDDLWVLLQNKVWRLRLREYIIEHKLSDDSWLEKMVAEGLGAIAALLLAA